MDENRSLNNLDTEVSSITIDFCGHTSFLADTVRHHWKTALENNIGKQHWKTALENSV
jgi:hypothetical protein